MKKTLTALLTGLLLLTVILTSVSVSAADGPGEDIAAVSVGATEPAEAPTEAPTEAPAEPVEAMPRIVTAEPAKDGVKLSFTSYDGAAKYRVFYKKSDGSGWKGVGDTAALSFTHTGLADYTEYIYTVRALDKSGKFCSSYDKEGFCYKYLPAPKLKKAESVSGGVTVSWNAVKGAPGYRVYVKTTGSWRWVADVAGTSFTDNAVTSGTAYTYTVKVRDNENGVLLSYHDTAGIKVAYVAEPSLTGAAVADGGIKVTWKKSAGAAKYRVFIKKTDGTGWKGVGDTSSTSFTHKGLTNGTRYTYTVRALSGSGAFASGYDKTGVTALYHSTPVPEKAVSEFGGQRVSWKAVKGAVRYRIYVKDGSAWKGIGYSDTNSYLNTAVRSGTTYTYTVRVCSADGKILLSWFAKSGVSGTYVASPGITAFTPVAGGTKVTWEKSAGAAKYRLFYKKPDGSGWKGIGDTTGTSLTHTGPADQTVYTYTVRALDKNGTFISGFDKAGRDYRYIAPPRITKATYADGSMKLSWRETPNVAGYVAYRKTYGGTWASLGRTGELSFTDDNVDKNTLYAYTLRGYDYSGALCTHYFAEEVYYYNGVLANGKYTVGGASVMFSDGRVRQGFVTIDGKTYYYNSKGVLMKDGLVGSDKEGWRYADKNGVINSSFTGVAKGNGGYWYVKKGVVDKTVRAAVSYGGSLWNVLNGKARRVETDEDEVLYRALKLVSKVTKESMTKEQKLRAMWDYIKDAYEEMNPREDYCGMDWPIIYANDMLIYGKGNCLSYGAEFAYLAKAIGYDNCYACNSGGHGWAEINGLVYDPEWARHTFTYSYYALSYNTKTDQDYKGAISAGLPWMHIKICADYK